MTNEFLTDLFGEQEGIIYAPVKGEIWEQYFFEWPQERAKLERHLKDYDKRDVYISPVLFSERKISTETFKGTSYLWTEFDGSVPKDFITPTMRVMSSQEGHEHWYWKLDEFVTNKAVLEDLTRRIAYHYGADLSVWDYQNVLRPVDTWNHKRNKPVTLLDKNNTLYSINDFLGIPIPPIGSRVDVKMGTLPSKDLILAKYRWNLDTLDLLFKDEIPQGKRSDALARLVHECIELGLSNEETYVLLEDRDSVWGKYVGRNDRQKRLEATIANVRARKATVAEIVQGAPEVYRFHDFMRTNIKLKWAIEGLLPVAGSMVIFGPPEVGKTTFSLDLGIALALHDKFLAWNVVANQRVLFISLEMQHYEVKQFFEDMKLPEEEQAALQEKFYIWPIGNAYPFDTPDQQIELIKYIKMHKIQTVIVDSHSIAMYGSVTSDDDIKRLYSFFNEDIRRDLKCSYIFIHHPRKESIESQKRDLELDDIFGSMYIAANAQTVISLKQKKSSTHLTLKILKTRHSQGQRDFILERTPDRGFKLVGAVTRGAVGTPSNEGDNSTEQKAATGSLGAMLEL